MRRGPAIRGVVFVDSERTILPSNVLYRCVRCGECCRASWQVLATEEENSRFADTDWPAIVGRENENAARVIRDGVLAPLEGYIKPKSTTYIKYNDDFTRKFRTCGPGCALLDSRNLCIMHSEKGIGYKAHICKSFPVRLLHLPGNAVQACFSFFCPGVAGNGGDPLDAKEILENAGGDADRTVLSDRLPLSTGLEIGFGDMLKINHFLSDFMFGERNAGHLNDPGYVRFPRAWDEAGSAIGTEDRLAAAVVFVVALDKIARTLHSEDPAEFPARFTREVSSPDAMLEMLKNCVKAVEGTSKNRKNASMIAMAVISLQQSNVRGMMNLTKALGILFNMLKYSSGWGSFNFKERGFSFKFSQHQSVSADHDDPAISDLLERYLSHSIFRKRIFFESGLLRGYQYMALFHSIVRWFSRAFAVRGGRASSSYEDYLAAVAFVEKEYAHHTKLMSVLETNPHFSKYFDPLMANVQIIKSLVTL